MQHSVSKTRYDIFHYNYIFSSGDKTSKPRKRKRRSEVTPQGEPPKKVQIRQIQRQAKAIRNDADSDAIQLAAAQDFKKRGLMDAYYVSKVDISFRVFRQ